MAIRRIIGAELVGMRAVICQAAGTLALANWVLRAAQLQSGE